MYSDSSFKKWGTVADKIPLIKRWRFSLGLLSSKKCKLSLNLCRFCSTLCQKLEISENLLNDSATHCTWYAFAPEERKQWALNDTCTHAESFLVKFNYHFCWKMKVSSKKNNTLHLHSFSSMLTNVPTFFKYFYIFLNDVEKLKSNLLL